MAKAKRLYSVTGTVVGGKYLGDFEATSAAAAIRLAEQSDACSVRLCHHCADLIEDPEITDMTAEEVICLTP